MDSTRSTASGARRPEDDPAAPAEGGIAGPDGGPAPVVAQRHDLPRRKAGTMPDLSRVEEEPGETGDDPRTTASSGTPSDDTSDGSSDGAHDGAQDGSSDGAHDGAHDDGGTATQMMPVVAGATSATASFSSDETSSSGATSVGASRMASDGGPRTDDADGPADRPVADADDHSLDAGADGPYSADAHAVGGSTARTGAHDTASHDGTTLAAAAHTAVDKDTTETDSHSGSDGDHGTRDVAEAHTTADTDSHQVVAADPASNDTASPSARPLDKDAARRAAVRDQAVAAKPVLARFLQVVVALFFPVVVVAAAVRAVATSSFLWFEYHRPGFPADQYGFSLDDRMTYGSYALDYVVNLAPARYLGGLVTPSGDPLFLETEVGHMADVKGVLGLSFFIALVLFVLSVLACVYLARRYKGGIRRALFAGAVLTLVGIVTLTVLAVLAWETFFTQVHALFFKEGTWTFRVDDTLIRLFPEQFWTDSAITIAVLVLGATLLTLVLAWPTKARRERSMLAQEAAQTRYREALDAS
ncbi:TIGR01906 family membrane protein [Arthrobacter agilis]|uniref:TIGR01906 family membrane protein n=1 Tax=Arthrobacter agilis TaxID=37921 RepID=UPI0027D89889|nr:TIGR01906 family membrane protein [Arthrobacter agilis]